MQGWQLCNFAFTCIHFRAVVKMLNVFVVYSRGCINAARSFVHPQGAGRARSTGLRHTVIPVEASTRR
jgi:hypothetical protein